MDLSKLKFFRAGDVFIIALILAVAAYSFKHFSRPQGQSARVSVQGKPYGEWMFSQKPEHVNIHGKMEIEISEQGVRVVRSQCPRQICRHSGAIRHQGQAIVCVPNRIVIEITSSKDSLDAVAQ